MDWFKGKSEPETIDFPIQLMGLIKPVNFPIFPLIQSIESQKLPLNMGRSCKFSPNPIH